MEFDGILKKLIEARDLSGHEAADALNAIMDGQVNPSQIAAFLALLAAKGETVEEFFAFANVMRGRAVRVETSLENLVDTAGTGGDGSGTFNISTAAAIVAAGVGARVAKHGNKAASSKSGSADVLEELGVKISVDAKQAQAQLGEIGISFLFAPLYHPAMKAVAQVRRELGFKTVFNVLGPLTNPAGAKRQVVGVYEKALVEKIALALQKLGTQKALVVCSDMDEISASAPTVICEASGKGIEKNEIVPEDFGIQRSSLAQIRASGKQESAKIILGVLEGKGGRKEGANAEKAAVGQAEGQARMERAARDVVLLNAAGAIYASGIAASLKQGVELAAKSIDEGKAMQKLEQLRGYNGHS